MIEVSNITKYYAGFPAITDISFHVEKGEILGFLGPNGAGKSTTMKIITGFIPPSKGTVSIAGFDVVEQSVEARRHIGYLPETVPLYLDMILHEYLSFMGTIRGMSRNHLHRRIDEVIEICRLEEYRTSIIGKLSKGFKQRLGIAQAILHEPDVLILDEPTIGIDPIQVSETRQLIRNLGGDQTLILSSHILPEVSLICQRVIIIHEGQIVAIDTPEQLAANLATTEKIEVEIRGPNEKILRALEGMNGVQEVARVAAKDAGTHRYVISTNRGPEFRSELACHIVGQGWGLMALESVGMTLEDIFLRLTTEEGESSE